MIWWAAALLLFQQNPHTTAADVELGKKLYGGRCAGCHGPTGDGGKGTNLAMPQLPRAQTDEALYRVIREGLRDTEMPAHNMTPARYGKLRLRPQPWTYTG
jgi:mono/diheme cytochrome c family protein